MASTTPVPSVPTQRADADALARQVEEQLTDDERFSLIIAPLGALRGELNPDVDPRIPETLPMSAGYTPAIERLGVPALRMSDASMGVTNPGYRNRDGDTATAMPACIALGASFNPALARAAGQAIAREARSKGFNVQLAGGANLMRDPRNGRNYEYFSEDPWHTAVLAGESIAGIQGERVISTIKHFTLNCQETNRHWLDAIIDPDAHRESDLLAFEIAIERGRPGAVMGGYNKVNGEYLCGNRVLLEDVLKGAWAYPGWVMSDWGATLSWEFALNGLDQECGVQLDVVLWGAEAFTERLRQAYADGRFPKERLSDMVRRILRSVFAVGVDRWEEEPEVDLAAHDRISLETARQGIVLLKNEDAALPLAPAGGASIAVIGGHANVGVPSGVGSGAVVPRGGYAEVISIGGAGPMGEARNLFLMPSPPLKELKARMPDVQVEFDPGMTPAEAALLAKRCDVAVVFALRVEGESYDNPDLSLPWGQDAVIDAVAEANSNTIVVLETGNPVAMPWRDKVKAIVQAWYGGQSGGQAIAEVLTGEVNPSGRLPITFPSSLDQTPHPELPGLGTPFATPTRVEYHEGAEVGYRWFAKTGATPLYAFGHGLSYTTFAYSDLVVHGGETITASFVVTNTGERAGADVAQLYLTDPRMRLLGFERVELEAGESRRITLEADRRLPARFERDEWHIAGGVYRVAVGRAADALELTADTMLTDARFGR
jgi:beta-glucosidase